MTRQTLLAEPDAADADFDAATKARLRESVEAMRADPHQAIPAERVLDRIRLRNPQR